MSNGEDIVRIWRDRRCLVCHGILSPLFVFENDTIVEMSNQLLCPQCRICYNHLGQMWVNGDVKLDKNFN